MELYFITYKKIFRNLVENKWSFCNNHYESPIQKYKEKYIRNMRIIKDEIKMKLGFLSAFVFLCDYIYNKDYSYNKNHLDKCLFILFHLISDVKHTDIQDHMGSISYYNMQKDFFKKHEESLNLWCDRLLNNYFSTQKLRLIGKKLNIELSQYTEFSNFTFFLNIYDSRIDYTNNKMIYKNGYMSFILIDINGMILYASESILCSQNKNMNSNYNQKFVNYIFNKINFLDILNDTDCVLINTGLMFLDGYITLKEGKINHKIMNFYLNEYPSIIKETIYSYNTFNELYKTFPKLCMTNNSEKGNSMFTSRIKLCSTLYNIRKISQLLNLDNETPKYTYWYENNAGYFNPIYQKDNKEDNEKKQSNIEIKKEMEYILLKQEKKIEDIQNEIEI